jgi:protein SCO1/2
MIEKMAALYRVYISKADETDDGDYLVDHSIVLYLVGPDGKFRDFFTQGMKASDVVDKVRKVVKEDAAEAAA